ncbi:MAG: hypothetical protein Aurels2KO_05540 [Aureliella sp.]
MRIWSIIAAVALSVIAAPVSAQETAAAPKVAIAVVDIGHILQNHPTMKGQMEQIKTQMEAADKEMATRRDGILKQMEQLREQYTEGTPDYEAAEKRIAEQDTEFRLQLIKEKKRFEEMQAMVVYKVHTDITNLVKAASQSWGTQVVLRVNRQAMDPKKPETVQLVMSQDVIFFNPSVDLTDWVLGQLNRTAQAAGATAR